jgi:hypothetical protein
MSAEDENTQGAVKKRVVRVKQHFSDNKKTYLVGAGCLTAGYFLRPQVVNIVDVCNLKYKSPTTTNVITILERKACREPIPVRDKLTGEAYRSFRRASEVTGETLSSISKDAHGAAERFERLPEAVFA